MTVGRDEFERVVIEAGHAVKPVPDAEIDLWFRETADDAGEGTK